MNVLFLHRWTSIRGRRRRGCSKKPLALAVSRSSAGGRRSSSIAGCWCPALLALAAWGGTRGVASAQEQGEPWRAATASAVQLDEADNTARAHLERVQRYLADAQWDEAIEALRGLMDASGEQLLALPLEAAQRREDFVRYVPLRHFVQWRLAALAQEAPQALEAYRQRVDPLAEVWLKQALAERDAQRLQELADRFFVSRSGDEALWHLGEIELERGHFARARAAWERLRPPPGEALRPPRLTYPDSDLDLGGIYARLALVAILEGSAARSPTELAELEQLAPDATGTLGGRSGRYVELLQDLSAARQRWPAPPTSADWTTFGGSAARGHSAGAGVDVALQPLWSVALPRRSAVVADQARAEPATMAAEDWLCYHPLVFQTSVLVATGDTLDDVHGYDLATGRPLWLETSLPPDAVAAAGATGLRGTASGGQLGTPHYTLTLDGDRLYAKLGPQATALPLSDRREPLPGGYLTALDLQADKKRLFEIRFDQSPWGEGWAVEGVPLAADGRLYVALRQQDGVRTQFHVVAFDSKRGELVWQRFIAAAETFQQGATIEYTQNLLSLDEGTLYLNTNRGAIAALRARDGQIHWVTRYPQVAADDGEAAVREPSPGRGLTPCVIHQGLVFAAPADSDCVFALEAASGLLRWATPRGVVADIQFLLGVGQGNLLVSGDRLVWIDAASGDIKGRFPATVDGALRGTGRGVLAGTQVYWPTRDRIYVFDQGGPQPTRQPIELAPLGLTGGNLVIARDLLLIAAADRLSAFNAGGPATPREP